MSNTLENNDDIFDIDFSASTVEVKEIASFSCSIYCTRQTQFSD